ncbi:MAG: PilN domain-containing protein [Myxococcales bacterium]
MIRINLLPVKAAKKRESGQKQLFLFVVALALGIGGNWWWYSQTSQQEERERVEVQRTEKEIADLNRIIGEVQNYEKENKALEEKLKVLDTLEKGRTGPVKMLDAMATSIPKNVWLIKLEESGGAMRIDGSAVSNDDLAEFMKAMNNVVWTPQGMGRLVESGRRGETSKVELSPSGQIADIKNDQIGQFFTNIQLKRAELTGQGENRVVSFSMSLSANFTI